MGGGKFGLPLPSFGPRFKSQTMLSCLWIKNTIDCKNNYEIKLSFGGGGQVVGVHSFKYDNLSSNLAQVYNFYYVNCLKKEVSWG